MQNFKKLLFIKGILLIIILFLSNANAQLANSPWPMFGHDEQHTNASLFKGPDSIRVAWTFQLDGSISPDFLNSRITASPIIGSDGTVYISTAECALYAINRNGVLLWKTLLGDGKCYTPAIASDSTLYIVAGEEYEAFGGAYLYAISKSGNIKWRLKISALSASSPVIGADGTVYVGKKPGVIAINPDGTIKWTFVTPAEIVSSPAIGFDGTIYFGNAVPVNVDPTFYAVNPNGTLKWKYDVSGSAFSPSIDLGGIIYYGAYDKFYAFNPDGTVKWSYQTYKSEETAIGPYGTIYCSHSSSWPETNLLAFKQEGTLAWEYTLPSGYTAPVVDSVGTIYIASGTTIITINPNGTLRWSNECLPEESSSRLVLGPNRDIYLVIGKNKLCALTEPRSGSADLVIKKIEIDPQIGTNVGAKIGISAVIQNIAGDYDAEGDVAFYFDCNFIGKAFTRVSAGIYGQTRKVTLESFNLEVGEHIVSAYINNVSPQESDTTNNSLSKTYFLRLPIQQRIDATSAGTIAVEPGTYRENITLKSNINIVSMNGMDSTFIDGGGTSTIIDMPYWNENMHIEGFTIRNGETGIDMDNPYNSSVKNCRIVSNNKGIFIYGIRGENIVSNNIIENNSIGIDGNNPKFQVCNNTIVKNYDYGIKSIGFYQSTPDIKNCILWGNGDDLGETAKAEYSCIKDNDSGTGNIHDNPQFVNYDNADYHLQANSPCIDRGSPSSEYNDPEDSNNPGFALSPAMGTVKNDMGVYGGPGVDLLTVVNDDLAKISQELPNHFMLFQNYPNPFNPETTIKYQLAKNSNISIKIYNLAGQLIKTLVDHRKSAGYYFIIWNGKDDSDQNVSSGIYFYSLITDNFIQTKKILLLR